MTRDDILRKLTAIMRETFGDPTLEPALDTTSDDIAEWDSANHVLMMVAIETEFDVIFEPEEITAPENVGELVDLIQSKLR